MKLSEWQMFDTTKVNKSGRRVILYLFVEIKGHWRASVASETLTGVTQSKIGDVYLLGASIASETLTGVTQLKIGDVCLLASETVLGVDNAKSGICYIYMYVWMVRMLFKRAHGELFSPKNTAI